MIKTPSHFHRRSRRHFTAKGLANVRKQIDFHTAKGRTLVDIVTWLGIPMSQLREIIEKTGGQNIH